MTKIKNQFGSYAFAQFIFLLLHLGLIIELMLIGHYESFWQYLPLVSLILGLISVRFNSSSLHLVKFIYILIILTGLLGVFLHLKNNWEFELEMYADISMIELIRRSFTGAVPALAPGSLVPIGLMGFLLIQLKSNQSKR